MALTKVNKTVADLPNLSKSLILETVSGGIKSYIDTGLGGKSDTSHTHSTYAPINNPSFTGNPLAPTQSQGNRTNRLATTAFVGSEIDALRSSVGMIRAYVVFDGITGVIKKAKNVSAVLKTAKGKFTITIIPGVLTDANYAVIATSAANTDALGDESVVYRITTPAKTTTSLSVAVTDPGFGNNEFSDCQEVSVVVIE